MGTNNGDDMYECLILGDSIAVGTKMFRKECVSYAKSGINSKNWNIQYLHNNLNAHTVIISLGSNDHSTTISKIELLKIRNRVKANKVYWIMPAIKPQIQNIIKELAFEFKDTIIYINNLSNDKVHPTITGYRLIAQSTK